MARRCRICPRWYIARRCNVDADAACEAHLTQVVELMLAGPHEWGTLQLQRTSLSIVAEQGTYTVVGA